VTMGERKPRIRFYGKRREVEHRCERWFAVAPVRDHQGGRDHPGGVCGLSVHVGPWVGAVYWA
jgi:hypothetical protein